MPSPYSAATDKDVAPWALREGDAAAGGVPGGVGGRGQDAGCFRTAVTVFKVLNSCWHSGCQVMSGSVLIHSCALLLAGVFTPGGTPKAKIEGLVVLYVTGECGLPSSVDYGARATVTWMFARIGLHLTWHDGAHLSGSPDAFVIHVRYVLTTPLNTRPEAIAYAWPFSGDETSVMVICDRLLFVVGQRRTLLQPLLTHVLAHEIAHALEVTDAHSEIGIMKRHWTEQDYSQMERRPLSFTFTDVQLIHDGLRFRHRKR